MLLSQLINQLKCELSFFRRVRTSKAYETVLRSATSFAGHDLTLAEVFNVSWLSEYQTTLIRRGLKRNTIVFYMRTLRSINGKAVSLGLCPYIPHLFLNVYTTTDTTPKRFVSPAIINRIAGARLCGTLEFCRDIFMLCFHLQGMTFVDLAYLRKADFQEGYITYRRQKSRSEITVKVNPEALRILRKYAPQVTGSEYLFPIIVDNEKDHYVQYQSALRSQNRNLKKLAAALKLGVTLTTYVARHSWATMAYRSGVPTAMISEAMGHKTEEMTRVYLASLGREKVDRVNEAVSRALRKERMKEKRMSVLQDKTDINRSQT